MDNLVTYQNYAGYKKAVDTVLNRTVEDFIVTGYLLKKGRDTDILKESGYANVNEFAAAEYHLDATQVSRYIRINDKFSEGGYSERLQTHYEGYGYAKLALMLTLPDAVNEELSPSFSKAEIQAVKEEIESERELTDIEVLLEGEKEEQREWTDLDKGLHQLFEEEPELFVKVYEAAQRRESRVIMGILAPSGEKIYSVRIQGCGRVMLFIRENENTATVLRVRSNEKEQHTGEEILQFIDENVSDKPAKERWTELYGKEFPEIAPVQPENEEKKPKQRKESKVSKAKTPEKEGKEHENTKGNHTGVGTKTDERKTEEADPNPGEYNQMPETKTEPAEETSQGAAVSRVEEPKKEEVAPAQKVDVPLENTEYEGDLEEDENDQIPGQMEVQDYPELMPEVKRPYGSRKAYLDTLTESGAAEYMAQIMREDRCPRNMFSEKPWIDWFMQEVDDKGRVIEVVEEE